jgi:hypothetical protein
MLEHSILGEVELGIKLLPNMNNSSITIAKYRRHFAAPPAQEKKR